MKSWKVKVLGVVCFDRYIFRISEVACPVWVMHVVSSVNEDYGILWNFTMSPLVGLKVRHDHSVIWVRLGLFQHIDLDPPAR